MFSLGGKENLPRNNVFYHFSLFIVMVFFRKHVPEVFLVNCGLKQLHPRLSEAIWPSWRCSCLWQRGWIRRLWKSPNRSLQPQVSWEGAPGLGRLSALLAHPWGSFKEPHFVPQPPCHLLGHARGMRVGRRGGTTPSSPTYPWRSGRAWPAGWPRPAPSTSPPSGTEGEKGFSALWNLFTPAS